MRVSLVLLLLNFVHADWINELRLTLANFALSKAASVPNGFECAIIGKQPKGCYCWNPQGNAASQQTKDYCHMPPQCLSTKHQDEGAFKFEGIAADASLPNLLTSWGVPPEMFQQYEAAVMFDSATFVSFDFVVNGGGTGTYVAHVGSCRKFNGTIQAGWVYGNVKAELIQPMVRHTRPGQCHGTTKDMKERSFTDLELALIEQGLSAFAFKEAAKLAQAPGLELVGGKVQAAQPPRMTEYEFLTKWPQVTMLTPSDPSVWNPTANDTVAYGNPFSLLLGAVTGITTAWQGVVAAFASKYEEQLVATHLNNGWTRFKVATKIFKGAGLDYLKADEFFANVRQMIRIPEGYSAEFDQQIQWIKFFDNVTWSSHDTQWSQGDTGSDTVFTMYAMNRAEDQKIDVLFLTCSESFKLADDYFVISEAKSRLGGLFSSKKIRFKNAEATISNQDLMFVSEYFTLLAYQQIAMAEGLAVPPDPSFPQASLY